MSKVTGIFGPRGTGKTSLAASRMAHDQRTLIFDPNHERAWASAADEIVIASPRVLAEALKEDGVTVYRPEAWDEESGESPLTWPVSLAYLLGNCSLIIDEAHLFCSPNYLPPVLKTAIRTGRHRNLSITYITQSWSAVSRAMTSNTQEFIFFHIIEPRDLEGIRERFGRGIENRVRALRGHEYESVSADTPEKIEKGSDLFPTEDKERREDDAEM